VLINNNGKVRNAAIPKTVSLFFVLSPKARDIPDQAIPKKAMMTSMSRYPGIPVSAEAPNTNARPKIIDD